MSAQAETDLAKAEQERQRLDAALERLQAQRIRAVAVAIRAQRALDSIGDDDQEEDVLVVWELNGLARGSELVDGLDAATLKAISRPALDAQDGYRIIDSGSLERAIAPEPYTPPASLAESDERTSVAYREIQERFVEIERDSTMGLAADVRATWPDATGLRVSFDHAESSGERSRYRALGVYGADGEIIQGSEQWLADPESVSDAAVDQWRDALRKIADTQMFLDTVHGSIIRFDFD